jgi:hypothetical protein
VKRLLLIFIVLLNFPICSHAFSIDLRGWEEISDNLKYTIKALVVKFLGKFSIELKIIIQALQITLDIAAIEISGHGNNVYLLFISPLKKNMLIQLISLCGLKDFLSAICPQLTLE